MYKFCNRLRAANSKRVGNAQDAVKPSDPILTSGWVQNFNSLWERKKKKKRKQD